MKKIILFPAVLILMCSCNKQDIDESNHKKNTDQLFVEQLFLTVSNIEDGTFIIEYTDGRILKVKEKKTEDYIEYIVSGTRTYNQTLGFLFTEDSSHLDVFDSMRIFSYDLNHYISNEGLEYIINGFQKAPCSQHPSDESFVNCFKREVDEFCNSFASCVFLAANAKLVATLIAIHCVWCSETERGQ